MSCFTSGSQLTTLRGEIPVELLAVGDRVVTRDNGLRTIRRISRRDFDYAQLAALPHLQPVLVTIGALGKGLPERDMLISPNQRLLVTPELFPSGDVVAKGAREALVAAKNLTDHKAIRPCQSLGVSYFLVEFDRNECVLANGIWVEAFCQQDQSDGARRNAQRNEVQEIFPGRSKTEAVAQTSGPNSIPAA